MPSAPDTTPEPLFSARLTRGLRRASEDRRVRHVAYALALTIMVVGIWYALRTTDLSLADLRWGPLLALLMLGIPATIALNAAEMELSARLIGQRFGVRRALTLTVFASASNMLPLPGAAMVRVAGLTSVGGTVGRAAGITLAIALLWLGVALLFSGTFLVGALPLPGGLALTAGLALLAGVLIWCRRLTGRWAPGLYLGLVKLGMVTVSVLRLFLCFLALGDPATLSQVSVFAISGIVGSAASIVPAGLGVRELVSAGLAPIVGLSASGAFLVTALDRLAGMSTMLSLAALLAAADIRPAKPQESGA